MAGWTTEAHSCMVVFSDWLAVLQGLMVPLPTQGPNDREGQYNEIIILGRMATSELSG